MLESFYFCFSCSNRDKNKNSKKLLQNDYIISNDEKINISSDIIDSEEEKYINLQVKKPQIKRLIVL